MITLILSLLFTLLGSIMPVKTYVGINHPVKVNIDAADTLLWLNADNTLRAKVAVKPGEADLASLFDNFWLTQVVTYVQPMKEGKAEGSPLVVQPLLTVRRAHFDRQAVKMVFRPARTVVSGVRIYQEKLARINTDAGVMTFRLRPDQAPNTVWNFMSLAEGGFYDDITFHRIVPEFVIQAGDPTGSSMGGPGYQIDFEESHLRHDFGVLSMARNWDDPDSNGSQFFICLSRRKTQNLDGLFVSFGEMVDGADVIRKIASAELKPGTDSPVTPPVIHNIEMIPAPPREAAPAEPEGSADKETADKEKPVER